MLCGRGPLGSRPDTPTNRHPLAINQEPSVQALILQKALQ